MHDHAAYARLRVALALTGGAWAVGAPLAAAADTDVLGASGVALVAMLTLVSVFPFVVYVLSIGTRVVSVLGGVALAALPAVAYGDFFLGGEDGASFAFATVPVMNMMVLGGVLLADRALQRHGGTAATTVTTRR